MNFASRIFSAAFADVGAIILSTVFATVGAIILFVSIGASPVLGNPSNVDRFNAEPVFAYPSNVDRFNAEPVFAYPSNVNRFNADSVNANPICAESISKARLIMARDKLFTRQLIAKNFPSDVKSIPVEQTPKGLSKPKVELRGAPGGNGKVVGPIDVGDQLHLIDGATSAERWQKFCLIQPSVLGMKLDQVQKNLGKGLREDSRLGYTIEERQLAAGKGICSIQVTFHIFDGAVESYEMSTVWKAQVK